jgi:chemotaxis protein methyltransferase CheR
LRGMVQFRPLNLLNDFSALGTFDVVFCRNVLIYFDQNNKTAILDRLARQISEDGYLVLGAAETVIGLTTAFKPLADKRGLYVPTGGAKQSVQTGSNVIRLAAINA